MTKKNLVYFFLVGGLGFFGVLYFFDGTFLDYNYGPSSSLTTDDAIEPKESRILFTGDVFLGRDVEYTMSKHGADYPFSIFTDDFSDLDALVINFEAPIPEIHTPVPSMGMNFSVATSTASLLKNVDVTHVSLANNHTLDKGPEGYNHTQNILLENNLAPFGHPNIVDKDSLTTIETAYGEMAIIGLHTLYSEPEITDINELFAKHTSPKAMRVVYIHWGEEYMTTPSVTQREYARELIDKADVDLIIGHHPHVVQTVEIVNGVPVFYSLGNTIFDQYFSWEVQTGLLLEFVFSEIDRKIMLHPISSLGSKNKPYLMPAREKTEFFEELADSSDISLQSSIKVGEINW